MNEPATNNYDEVPYSSFTFPQTRPDRLATLAAVHGMEPAPPENCRVLELGCGDGTNLLSFAYVLPESRFVGVDLAKGHIEQARTAAVELSVENVEFHCEDVMSFTQERYGEFDYIIAHGLFSWVPEPVREKVLAIYAECLAPHGVGYISYNTYPGCKMREVVWDMMKYYTSELSNPMQKVGAGVQFLNFLNFATEKETAYHGLIENELSQFSHRTAENIFHDDFASINRPFYFHEFVNLLKPHGLQFLSEVDAYWSESKLRPEIAAKIDELGDDVIKREQYIDFIKGRPFRSSLICRESSALNRHPSPDVIRKFYLASQAEPVSGSSDLRSVSEEKFKGIDGEEITVTHPLTKAALYHLQSTWSRFVSFDELMQAASDLSSVPVGDEIEQVSAELFELFKKSFIYLHRYRPEFPSEPSAMPAASRFVQWQIRKKCNNVTALSGMNLQPSGDLMRLILLLCDGTRDRATLVKDVTARIEFPAEKKDELTQSLPEVIEEKLNEFAKLGLLES